MRLVDLVVEHRSVVVGPLQRVVHARDLVVEMLARLEVLETDRVFLVPPEVDRVGEHLVARTDLEGAEAAEIPPLRQGVLVQQHLLCRVQVVALATVDPVLLTFLRARVIEIVVDAHGHREVGLLDPAQHLVVELLLELFGVLHDGGRVRVLLFEVIDDLRVVALSKPVVRVEPLLPVPLRTVGDPGGDRRRDLHRRSDIGKGEPGHSSSGAIRAAPSGRPA